MTSITKTEDAPPFDGKGVRWNIIAWFLGVVVTALTTYNATANSFDQRLTRIESQNVDRDRRLERMENKLDLLLDRR